VITGVAGLWLRSVEVAHQDDVEGIDATEDGEMLPVA
jgi:hypothetical protein